MNDTLWNVLGSAIGALAGSVPALLYTMIHHNLDKKAKKEEERLHYIYANGILQSCLINLSGVYTSLSVRSPSSGEDEVLKVPYDTYLQALNILAETNNLIHLSLGVINQTRDLELLSQFLALKSHIDQCLGSRRVENASDTTGIRHASSAIVEQIKLCEMVFKTQRFSLRMSE